MHTSHTHTKHIAPLSQSALSSVFRSTHFHSLPSWRVDPLSPAGGAAPVSSHGLSASAWVWSLLHTHINTHTQSRGLCNVYYYATVSFVKQPHLPSSVRRSKVTENVPCFKMMARAIISNIFQCSVHRFISTTSITITITTTTTACKVANTGLAEFTPVHAPTVQLVATLVMTSPPRATIGPETPRTCPIDCRWSDVSLY